MTVPPAPHTAPGPPELPSPTSGRHDAAAHDRRSTWHGLAAGATLAAAAGLVVVLVAAALAPLAADRPSAAAVPTPVPVVVSAKLDFACPVAGDVWFADTFGAPRPGGRVHRGEDLFAARGTPVVAVTSGEIAKAVRDDDGSLGGRRVWLVGDDGWWWYFAHLEDVAVDVGARVAAGDLLGTVGNSGNARTTPPHLHIEQHFGAMDGPFVSPFPTLSVLCEVTPVSPEN